MTIDKKQLFIPAEFTVRQAMEKISENSQKIVFIIDKKNKLTGSVTDGDIRRWILKGGKLTEKAIKIANKKPKTANIKYDIKQIKDMMLKHQIECVPVVSDNREVLDVLTWKNVFSGKPMVKGRSLNIQVVIMAGGKGTRLDPFTRILPKPLIPIGDKPIIEIIMDRFVQSGIREFVLSLGHKAKMIKSYFEDSEEKYNIRYIEEKKPLGTAGSLLLGKAILRAPFIVTNCDIIVESDCSEIIKFHKDNKNDITLVVSCRRFVVPYGICEIENGGSLKSMNEKPGYDLLVNTGMYVLEKKIIDLIPKNKAINMNELVESAKNKGLKIGVFPINEGSWIDIGQWEEYRKAVEKMGL